MQLLEQPDKRLNFNPSRYLFPRQDVPQSVALSKKKRLKHSLVQKTALVSCENLSFKLGTPDSQRKTHEKIIAGDYHAVCACQRRKCCHRRQGITYTLTANDPLTSSTVDFTIHITGINAVPVI